MLWTCYNVMMYVQEITVLSSTLGQWEGLGRRVNSASARYRASGLSVSAPYTLSHFQRGSSLLKAVIYVDPESCQASAEGLHPVQLSCVFRNSNKDTHTHTHAHSTTNRPLHSERCVLSRKNGPVCVLSLDFDLLWLKLIELPMFEVFH